MSVSESKKAAKSSTVHSVVVAVQLLEFLAESGRPQRVTDIATFLGMTKARVSRHLSTLSELGMVARMPDKSGYRLGPTLFRLSNAALDQYEITNIAYRYMVVLRNQIQEALLLAIPAGGDALVVDGRTVTTVTRVGDDERAAELARMLGGDPRDEAGLAHAETLLERAGSA